jgi:regulator of replication initiation timing
MSSSLRELGFEMNKNVTDLISEVERLAGVAQKLSKEKEVLESEIVHLRGVVSDLEQRVCDGDCYCVPETVGTGV